MRIPIVLASTIILIGLLCNLFVFRGSFFALNDNDFISLSISLWACVGGLASAIFLIYGYLVSLRAFAESQKPKLFLWVENGKGKVIGNENEEHFTLIRYRNMGMVECKNLKLWAKLIGSEQEFEIPRLFGTYNLQIGDTRTRSIPTITYFTQNGIPKAVIDNLYQYRG